MTTPSITIRMYKQGLGDCFLLSFPRQDGSTYSVLIDCGAVTGTDSQDVIAAAQDVFDATHGHLDLLVGTHEHWDHLSGFNQAREIFDRFSIDNLWLAWTEDLDNPIAQNLVKKRAEKVAALQAALARMNAAENTGLAACIRQVLGFFGEDDANSDGLGATGRRVMCTTAEAMRYLRSRHTHFCTPGLDAPFPLDGVPGVRIYVLGPPTKQKYLRQDLPTQSGDETYGITSKPAEDSFYAALSAAGSSGSGLLGSLDYPFDDFYRVSLEEASNPRADDFYRLHYGFQENDADAWRRIDQDWLKITSELALDLDSDTNNTSLALAFEIGEPGSGRVLLFPGDAQVGNWLSWAELSWTVDLPGQASKKVNALDLLKNTVFYKVGHHGSHNATLSAQGLELMNREDLVAMIPVIHDMAVKKGWDAMPFDLLVERLKTKAMGRVVRMDTGIPPRQEAPVLSDSQWESFTSQLTETDLYIEYRL